MSEVTVTFATTAAVGSNAMSGNRLQTAPYPRILRKIGVTGSAAVRDSSARLVIGTTIIGDFFNSTVGVVNALEARDFRNVDIGVGATEAVNVELITAPTTNALAVTLIFEDLDTQEKAAAYGAPWPGMG